jgi:tungstate transport system ATP-binding protein
MKLAYKIKNLQFNYDDKFFFQLDSMNINSGEIIGITGLNGSGKSTLLKLLAFLLKPNSGNIMFFGNNVVHNNYFSLRQETTLLLQDPILLKRTVFENVAYGLRKRNATNVDKNVTEALERVGLSKKYHAKKYFNELSGGESKRVALAARIAIEPKVLLLDEPTTNIDKMNKDLIYQTLTDLNTDKNTTIIISSHDEMWLNNLTNTFVEIRV